MNKFQKIYSQMAKDDIKKPFVRNVLKYSYKQAKLIDKNSIKGYSFEKALDMKNWNKTFYI